MALATLDTPGLSQHAAFCPPPLHIQKKPRRATFHKRIFRKSTHHRPNDQYVYGPLDDIINEIRSNIWESPHDYSTEAYLLDRATPLEVPSTWTAIPLPVSRLPSNQPLTIRKNRESRSSASGSNMGDPRHFSRSSSQDDAFGGGPVVAPASAGTISWPLLDEPTSYRTADAPETSGAAGLNAQEAFRSISQNTEDRNIPTKRRPSVLRLFTGLSRLRRTDTGEISSGGDTSDLVSPTSLEAHNDNRSEDASQEPGEDAVEAYIRRNARK